MLDRPSPAAESFTKVDPSQWKIADAEYTRKNGTSGMWSPRKFSSSSWTIEHAIGSFQLKATEFGHVGIFPEQAKNWQWIDKQIKRHQRRLKVLNLFAYTGGSTMAAVRAGAEVVHVDSAKNVVTWARKNAQRSGLGDQKIRWICEDAVKFVQRELKRGNQYDAVILDPPSYGHGPKGEVWRISDGLMELLQLCAELTSASRAFFLLTCHSPGIGPAELEAMLADSVFGHCQAGVTATPLSIPSACGHQLPSGVVGRWPG